MIKPSIAELTKGEFNRYELVIAAAKCARRVTDEYVEQRMRAERMVANHETEKPLASLIEAEYRDQKAVKIAITRLAEGRYTMYRAGEAPVEAEEAAATTTEETED
jgi:DNA-directed RNA polymerase omega subunit